MKHTETCCCGARFDFECDDTIGANFTKALDGWRERHKACVPPPALPLAIINPVYPPSVPVPYVMPPNSTGTPSDPHYPIITCKGQEPVP